MSVRNLDALFQPSSVALVGASNRDDSVGTVVMRNLLRGGFQGPILPVNPKYSSIGGVYAYSSVNELPIAPDLAVICTPPTTVPKLVSELAERGTRAAIVMTAGLGEQAANTNGTLEQAMLAAARPHMFRILGPNCLGLMAPHAGLNASFAHADAPRGNIGFISQSGALCTAVLDWARTGSIGFSHFVSLGNTADVDFGDVLDYLASDPGTRAILLYIESVVSARKFLSAARAAARNKPVIAIKAGRVAEGERAAASHTGAMAGSDEVFDAALARAGVLRVDEIEELFDAVETLARLGPLQGNRLAILTNGGGPAVMATDTLIRGGGTLTTLTQETVQRLNEVLPPSWSRSNPIDIIGDAKPDRYAAALNALFQGDEADAFLVLHAPTAMAPGEPTASAVASVVEAAKKPVLTSWLGRDTAVAARRILANAGVPTYETPGHAVRAFLRMVKHHSNQQVLLEAPHSVADDEQVDSDRVRDIVDRASREQREWLAEPEVRELLEAYRVPTVTTLRALDAESAARAAEEIGFPVALKVLSPDVVHKSDVGGVVLDLEDREAVELAARGIAERIAQALPNARLEGFTVQQMARRPGAYELIVGASTDRVFGPFILFGEGGTAVEVIDDKALALPPLNAVLAREMIGRTRISRRLRGYRDRPSVDFDALERILVRLSQLVIDHPDIAEFEVNPLLADDRGVLALDARVRLLPLEGDRRHRLAIRPYPKELEERISTRSGLQVLIRPIRPDDDESHRRFLSKLTSDDVRFRFFDLVRQLPDSEAARYTQIDYDREMAFVGLGEIDQGEPEILGMVRAVTDSTNETAELAIAVRSDVKGRGLGHVLLEKTIRYCRERQTGELVGRVQATNSDMLELARSLGFRAEVQAEGDLVELRLRTGPLS